MKVAAAGKYWVRVNNLTIMKTSLTSYDGFTKLKDAIAECDKYKTALLPKVSGDPIYSVMVEDKDGNILYPEV